MVVNSGRRLELRFVVGPAERRVDDTTSG